MRDLHAFGVPIELNAQGSLGILRAEGEVTLLFNVPPEVPKMGRLLDFPERLLSRLVNRHIGVTVNRRHTQLPVRRRQRSSEEDTLR